MLSRTNLLNRIKTTDLIRNKMQYKVGDKVRIKSLDWYNTHKDKYGNIVDLKGNYFFVYDMSKYCGKIATIMVCDCDTNSYILDIATIGFSWTDEMFDETFSEDQHKEVKLIWKKSKKINQDEKIKMESKKVKITLPKNCEVDKVKTSVEDKFIIVEYTPKEKFEPKDGDVIYVKGHYEWLTIFQKKDRIGVYGYCYFCPAEKDLLINDNVLGTNNNIREIRPATIYERTILFDALKEHGLQWNAKEKKLEKIRWRAKLGGRYFFIEDTGVVGYYQESCDEIDAAYWEVGNYFETEQEAELYSEKRNRLFKNR